MIDETVYEQYGLQGNPFRIKKTIENIDSFHVNLPLDHHIESLIEQVLQEKNKQVIFLYGQEGMGKTQRVLFSFKQVQEKNIASHMIRFDETTPHAMQSMLYKMLPKGSVLLSNDKWQRIIAKLKKQVASNTYNPSEVGKALAEALNLQSPCFFIIDDLQYIKRSSDISLFLQSFHHLIPSIKSGVFILITSDSDFFSFLLKNYPAFLQQCNEPLPLPHLTDSFAEKIISKRLSSKRLVTGLDMMFPYQNDAIHWMNQKSDHNPKNLLHLADISFTAASYQKEIMITEEFTQEIYSYVKEQGLDPLKENKPDQSKERKPSIKQKIPTERILLDEMENDISIGPATDTFDTNDVMLLNKMKDQFTLQPDTQFEKNIDSFLETVDQKHLKNGVEIDSVTQENNFVNDSEKINAITSRQYSENQSAILENEALFHQLTHPQSKSEMMLSPEINDILSTTSNNKFAPNKNPSFEPNGKKKKGFSLKLKKRFNLNNEKKQVFNSTKKNKDISNKNSNNKLLDLVQNQQITKNNKALNKKLRSNQNKKPKTVQQKQSISSDITIKITCPECSHDFSAVLNKYKKEITCPKCHYSYHF